MWRSFGIRALEVWLINRLLASPIFHRMVGRVHQQVQRLKHGIPPEEMGGTKLERQGPDVKRFIKLFKEEVQYLFWKPPGK
ncbi:hypothetical protein ASPZODRAFT_127731 [Penicilliopsis zonata CBS 506.65]|uniref:Uncharacterized protein n=1 Tax=Penicilliopsis zonata CBS 506.65 TaxID=1073090 RepID=A0A1L9SX04_9EURO|nr:hypothetical protein ASPZODRAFT_127731 [Penicilliopsis zonata CBS 506.65]OJJ51621.1 hypothetical protein ASPZODRAFT_127731 [Penicilliopsis zonata CBS 506.65]